MSRLWRTLIRVVDIKDDQVLLVIPGLDPTCQHTLSRSEIPVKVYPGKRLHARVNLDAEITREKLIFMDWEEN